MSTPTPRTDAKLLTVAQRADFARQLERDLDAARQELAALREDRDRWESAVRKCVEWSNGREYEWGDRAENAFGFLHAAIAAREEAK